MKKVKKIKEYMNLISVLLNILITVILIGFLSIKQTRISSKQLEISLQQQKILEYQNKISEFEHSPYFNIFTYSENNETSNTCINELLYIENNGYPIKDYNIKVFSFLELIPREYPLDNSNNNQDTLLVPLKLYFAVGAIKNNHQGTLAIYSNLYNCRRFTEVQVKMNDYLETFDWHMDKFNIVEISYLDFKGENKIIYLSDRKLQMNKIISNQEGISYLNKYNKSEQLSIYDLSIENITKRLKIEILTPISR